MPSKFWRAVDAVKDQTSLSLAKVSKHAAIDVAVLKATSHDEVPIDERHVDDFILLLVSSPSSSAAGAVQALLRRTSRTRNWVVALKSLVLAFRALREGSAEFSREAAKPGPRRLLDLSAFCNNSSNISFAWDFTAFVRTYARYLDARLESALLGRLRNLHFSRSPSSATPIAHMKPLLLIDNIKHWQRLLGRAISTRPTGAARTNRLIQISLYLIVRESFDLYRDVSSGLSLMLDNFFHLHYDGCVETYKACAIAVKQFEELESFYVSCKKIGVGRVAEYPTVQTISRSLVKTLEMFLKDNRPSNNARISGLSKLVIPDKVKNSSEDRASEATLSDQQSSVDWASAVSDPRADTQLPARASLASSSSYEECKETDPDGWELLLLESASNMAEQDSGSSSNEQANYNNPFLHGFNNKNLSKGALPSPTFKAARASEVNLSVETGALGSSSNVGSSDSGRSLDDSARQQVVVREQQIWMQQQRKIIAKNLQR
ncbi:clathrin coat assembly protein AP180-like [Typha latifolia]|uniref:clathrin coat assembly protein AP180-like n=1 Tax=Typha latifolia TaxID=4733 RepID=UPI003C2C138A